MIRRSLTALILFLLCSAPSTLAQCAMCRASIANSDDPKRIGATVNSAILVLLVPTLVLISAIAGLIVRYYRADNKNEPSQ